MEIGEALKTYLTSVVNLNNYLNGKIFPVTIPQDVKNPCLKYQQVTSNRTESINHSDEGTGFFTLQFDFYSDTYNELKAISKQLTLALKNFNGLMGGVSGVDIKATRKPNDDIDDFDDDLKEYSCMQEYIFFYDKE